MPIITLTTDFGIKDPFVASVKGKIYSELQDVVVVDISNEVEPFDIGEGAFILKNSYKDFPDGTIHIVGVDDIITPKKKAIAALIDEHYFIASDNGILSLIGAEITPQEIIEINIPHVEMDSVFPTRDVFVPIACHLARGGKLSVVGHRMGKFKELSGLRPVVKDDKTIVGTVIYIDNYGNAITNISKKFFDNVGKMRKATVRYRNHEFSTIYKNYREMIKDFDNEMEDIGKGLALFGSCGFLEVAMYKANPNSSGAASSLYGLKKGTEIHVEFS
jgi:S-adenosylmethionine hydrolase